MLSDGDSDFSHDVLYVTRGNISTKNLSLFPHCSVIATNDQEMCSRPTLCALRFITVVVTIYLTCYFDDSNLLPPQTFETLLNWTVL